MNLPLVWKPFSNQAAYHFARLPRKWGRWKHIDAKKWELLHATGKYLIYLSIIYLCLYLYLSIHRISIWNPETCIWLYRGFCIWNYTNLTKTGATTHSSELGVPPMQLEGPGIILGDWPTCTLVIIIEGNLEVKLPTIWTDGQAQPGRSSAMEKVRREKIRDETDQPWRKSEVRRSEMKRSDGTKR